MKYCFPFKTSTSPCCAVANAKNENDITARNKAVAMVFRIVRLPYCCSVHHFKPCRTRTTSREGRYANQCPINAPEKGSARTGLVWSRGVARWFRRSLSVADPFVCRCLTSSAMRPFPHPAHRTGRADLPHPALGEDSRNRRGHCL